MKKFGLYFMIHSLGVVRGGMTRASLERAKLLRSYYEDVGLLTFDFNPDYDEVIEQLKSVDLWAEHMRHVNVYEFFMKRHQATKNHPEKREIPCFDDLCRREEVFDRYGRLRQVKLIDKRTDQLCKDYFLTPNGSCFFEREFHSITGKTLTCIAYHPSGKQERTFRKVKDYRNFFIQSLINQHENVVLVSDGRFADRVLFSVNDPKVARVASLHSHHLQSPYVYGSPVVKRNESIIHHLNKLDACVTLTERQAEHIRSRFGSIRTLHAIGHPVPTARFAEKCISFDPYTAVIVARYEGIKQIPHAIKAFKKVIKKVPKARLEIWGFGNEEKAYRRLIQRLKLEQHVFIKGFAPHPEKVFRKAAFSIVTSKSEAFAMVIVESMSVGTPVISYACDYGPVELIEHGKNGLLVPPNHVNELAKAMTELFQNKQKRNALSQEAIKIHERFHRETIAKKWADVFQQALKQKDQRVFLQNMSAHVTSLIYIQEEQVLFLKGVLNLQVHVTPVVKEHLHLSLQLRRATPLFDQYFPVHYTWNEDNTLKFQGKIANFSQFETGSWDFHLSVVCLNDCKFVKLAGKCLRNYESIYYRINNLKFKWHVSESSVRLKVVRANEASRIKLQTYRNVMISNLKQKMKAFVEK